MSDEAQRAKWRESSRKYAAKHKDGLAAYKRKYRANNPDKQREANLKNHYGLTQAQWDSLFVAQGSCCAICKSSETKGRNWHTDHCHVTNKVRGILCHHCNVLLGVAKDSVQTLHAAITYLRSY